MCIECLIMGCCTYSKIYGVRTCVQVHTVAHTHALRTYHAKLTVIGTICDLHRYGESMCCHASYAHRYVCVVCGYLHLPRRSVTVMHVMNGYVCDW